MLAPWTLFAADSQPQPPPLQLQAHSRAQIQALQDEKASRTGVFRKLDSQLVMACKRHHGQPPAADAPFVRPSVISHPLDQRLLVDIDGAVTESLIQSIHEQGGQVLSAFPQHGTLRAWLPVPLIESLANREEVRRLKPSAQATTHGSLVQSEADITHQANWVRDQFGIGGEGIRIGVLSDGVSHLAEAQAAGELPDITVLPGQAGISDTGEGTAMLELIHDLAPKASLYFATAFGSEASFAENIRSLQAAGCQIIVDDVTYFDESPFQDGLVSRAVSDVCSRGVLYFSSAGNSGNLADGTACVWEGDFVDGGSTSLGRGGRLHQFGTGTANLLQPGGSQRRADLFWSDPLGHSDNDYDLFVLDSAGNVIASSTNIQNGNDDPYESVNDLGSGDRIVIVKASGQPRFLHLSTGRVKLQQATSGTVLGHNASGATNAMSVAATWVRSPAVPFTGGTVNPVETFSSGGPRRMFYFPDGSPATPGNVSSSGGIVLLKPDITAADGVSTSVPGFETFFGTSAAAPHAAAIAALLWSYNPALTAIQVKQSMLTSALDTELAGPDSSSGYGIVMAPLALDAAPTPPPRLLVAQTQLSGGNGNDRIDANECNQLFIALRNAIGTTGQRAQGISATLRSLTPGVVCDPKPIPFPDVDPGQSSTNSNPFLIGSDATFGCGSTPQFELVVSAGNTSVSTQIVSLASSPATVGPAIAFSAPGLPQSIPDLGEVVSTVEVSNFIVPLAHVSVKVHAMHPYVSDLVLTLEAPDGTQSLLSSRNGSGGQNYGSDCLHFTQFDDGSTQRLSLASAPFVGTFMPDSPLSTFIGMSPEVVNGTWKLHVSDVAESDSGSLQCWTLLLSPTECLDGGGACFQGPSIASQPVSVTITNGGNAEFAVRAVGTPTLSYQWYFNDTLALPGATQPTLSLVQPKPDQAGSYRVRVTNLYGSVTSAPAFLNFLLPPTLVVEPTNTSVAIGEPAVLRVVALGSAPLQYQWFRKPQSALDGATNPDLEFASTQASDAGSYFVSVTNPYGSITSAVAKLTVTSPPVFTQQPISLTTNAGSTVQFSALAAGSAPIRYQWYLNETTPISGATNTSLLLANVTTTSAGTYSVIASNAFGSVMSDSAHLEIVVANHLPTVTWVAPTSGSSFGVTNSPIHLEATASDSDGHIKSIQFLDEGVLLAEAATPPYRFDWIDPSPGLHRLQAIAVDDQGGRSEPATISVQINLSSSAKIPLIASGDVWKYLDDGSDQKTNWISAAFDDSKWASGPSELGYGDAADKRPEATVLSFGNDANAKYITYYFRHAFVLSDAVAFTNLEVRLVRDDGGVVYLNGREVFRSNMPEGPITFETLATSTVNGNAEAQFFGTNVSATLLQNGTNWIAVEIHQVHGNSTDISFNLELLGLRDNRPHFVDQPEGGTFTAGDALQLNALAQGGMPLHYQWFFNRTNPLPGATDPRFLLNNLAPADSGNYTVVVTNTFGSITSAPAAVVVQRGADNLPPTIAWVTPETNTTNTMDQLPLMLEVAASDPEGEPLQVSFLANGVLLGTIFSPPYQLAWVDPVAQVYSLRAIATDDGGLSATSPIVRVRVEGSLASTNTLVRFGESWLYDDTGTDLGTSWASSTANAQGWKWGLAELGYGDAPDGRPETTVIGYGPDGAHKFPTAYFRHRLIVSDPNSFPFLTLHLLRDDGAVVYLNGTEILRDNLPDGLIRYTNFALTAITGAPETNYVEKTITTPPWLAGLNEIEVEIHQSSGSSSDLSFDLAAEISRDPAPKILQNPTSLAVTNGGRASFKVSATGNPTLRYQWAFNDTHLLANATNATLTLSKVDFSQAGNYRCIVSNSFGSVISANASLQVYGPGSNLPPVVSWVAPAEGASFEFGSPILLSAHADDLDGQVVRVEFLSGTTVIGTGTGDPSSFSWVGAVPGDYTLTARATDNLGLSTESSALHLTINPPSRITTSLIAAGSSWRYLDTGTNAGTAWRQPTFNDSSWPQGPAILGFGNASKGRPEATVLNPGSDPNHRTTTYYFRKPFVVTNFTDITRLEFRLLRDDGAAVYLNGTRVYRDNLPGGSLSYTTLASSSVTGADETRYFTNSAATTLLRSGTNVLAVEVHQASLTSDDLAFDLGLLAVVNSAPVILTEPSDLTVTNGSNASFKVVAIGTGTLFYQWYRNTDQLILGATSPTLTLNNVQTNQAGTYSVVVRNAFGSTRSREAKLKVVLPPPNQLPLVSILTPTNGASFLQGDIVSINVTATDPDGKVATVDLYSGNNRLVRWTQSPYLFDWKEAPLGSVPLRAVAIDNRGGSNTSATVTIQIQPQTQNPGPISTLIATGSVWRYLDTGVAPDAQWNQLGFDDSSWPSGAAELGYGDAVEGRPEVTVLQYGPNPLKKYISYYFRSSFSLTDSSSFSNLTVRLMRDDGGVVYLNGKEVFRSNMPGGTVTPTTLAQSAVNKLQETIFFETNVPPSLLRNGENLVAVEIHQSSEQSSDISFDLELIGIQLGPPIIVAPPKDVEAPLRGTAQFHVVAGGSQPLSYQWYVNGFTPLAGGTNATLTLTNLQVKDEGSYSVVVTNAFGQARSPSAVLSVLAPPSIVSQPQDLTLLEGVNGEFTIQASGSAPLFYQWFFNKSSALVQETNATLRIVGATPNQAGLYSVQVSNRAGSILSTNARLTVTTGDGNVSILTPPASLTVADGAPAQFSVQASGTAPLRYEWLFNGTEVIAGATNSFFNIAHAGAADIGTYSVRVSNASSSLTSPPAELKVLVRPTITVFRWAPTQVSLTFDSLSRLRYSVEFSDRILGSTWTSVPGAVLLKGTGSPITINDPNISPSVRFYRIVVE